MANQMSNTKKSLWSATCIYAMCLGAWRKITCNIGLKHLHVSSKLGAAIFWAYNAERLN